MWLLKIYKTFLNISQNIVKNGNIKILYAEGAIWLLKLLNSILIFPISLIFALSRHNTWEPEIIEVINLGQKSRIASLCTPLSSNGNNMKNFFERCFIPI